MVFFADRALPSVPRAVIQPSVRTPFVLALCAALAVLAAASPAYAQADFAGCKLQRASYLTFQQVAPNQFRLSGTLEQPVQVDCDDLQLFADTLDHFKEEGRLVAVGHVLFVSGTSRISAERVDFNTKTKTGTFYVASGTAMMKEGTPGESAGEQEPYAFFWGDELQKVGPKKYKIVRGGFTACVQPTPRWEVSSGTLELNLDDYVLLKNAVFKVKGVPLLYLPAFYYPMDEDERSTGFLMPTYGTGTIAGQKITNAFFWAIGRSHDATFVHDWFTKTGQALGSEYRYVLNGGSSGNARFHWINEKETTATFNGVQQTIPAKKSYEIRGDLVQTLGAGLRARGYVDYFSRLETQQKFQQNVYYGTNRTRRYGGNVSGSWAEYVLNATLEQRDIFDSENRLTRDGNLPRVSFSRGERPIGRSPIYFGVNSEYVTFVRKNIVDDETTLDQGLMRFDVAPMLRIPFTKWPFFTVDSVVSWRGTYWSESLDANQQQVPESLGRSIFDVVARIRGPVFHRIWDNANGRKVKHLIEPTLAIQRTTAFDDFNRVVRLDGLDSIVGDVTRYTYALNNRVYAKRENSREVLNVGIAQTYYTNPQAAQFDPNYQNFASVPRGNFSDIRLTVRLAPTPQSQASGTTEWDHKTNAIRSVAASGMMVKSYWLQAEGGWSLRRLISTVPGVETTTSSHFLNASTTLRTRRNDFGGTYSFHFDVRQGDFLQQRYMAYYNAQCCGVAAEWQTWNMQGTVTGLTTPQDRRFTISFTLAGIGAVPNFFGGMSGQQNRR